MGQQKVVKALIVANDFLEVQLDGLRRKVSGHRWIWTTTILPPRSAAATEQPGWSAQERLPGLDFANGGALGPQLGALLEMST